MKLETICLHGGSEIDATTSRALPLYRTSCYQFKDTEHAANLFALKELGNIYTRLMNPTHAYLEQRVAMMDKGAAALALASGTSAIFYAIVNLCRQGDEIVSSNALYGGTFTQFNDILPQFGIKVRFVDARQPQNFAAAITDKTKLLFCETVSNPALHVTDTAAIAEVAHKNGIPLVVDSTFTTPALQCPIEHGADIIIHSLTKWLGGHGIGIGGIMVDGGRFDWKSPKFPLMTEPEESYHGIRWAYDLPEPLAPIAYAIRMRVIPLRNLGACISPDNAWLFLQGIETLPLRMERHCQNAHSLALYLKESKYVEWVRFPLFDQAEACKKYLNNTGGSMVVFGIKGGREAGKRFIEALQLFSHVANVGDAKSLAIHPATTTHSQLTPQQQLAGGISPELLRLSVGIEHIDDIVADVEQALKRAVV